MHDKNITIVTERGQTSIPADLRKLCNLTKGKYLHWDKISRDEIRITILSAPTPSGPLSTLGYAKRFNPKDKRSSDQILKDLRSGEEE